ncbi:acyl-CoA synthetase [Tropicimonas isoalkanivorans]|uniref:Fatty-acyl-CoA synthase n=1 Tax=Tropicimonas isoalkanivorans TaxID=441112 RepID=A0A1I1L6J6_9RHOB|nr:acyl-CoA synthetase [Tropicimonas isoalkanivorans]SFC66033.1 fatty-acyl-CoA synthase [Tropicimonas isoalkanivorans]
MTFASIADRDAIEREMPWKDRDLPTTIYEFLSEAGARHGARPAVTFQFFARPNAPAETFTWSEVLTRSRQAANLFRSLGVGENDVVAFLLPNCSETVFALLGGMIAGIVAPINPLLEPGQISAILRESKAKVLVTLRAFPKSDVAQKAAAAVADAPDVRHVLEVDMLRYLSGPQRWIAPFLRPKTPAPRTADVADFNKAMGAQPSGELSFADSDHDRVAAYFHTGGTTGMPKVAQHLYSGMIYNGWIGNRLLFDERDSVLCPLPLFHVFAVYPILMSMIASGSHVILPTPQGFRGEGVFDNFWKLIERWKITFMIGVPTAFAALMQRPVDADISTLEKAFSGSAPLPVQLYRRFEQASGVEIIEGYGLTEATCLVAINPVEGNKKVGSVGIPFPYTEIRILRHTDDGPVECGTDEVGEICVQNPGVFVGSTYTEADRNHRLFHQDVYLRTGDLGRIDEDGYLWITGRKKDLINRGGHNIDPAVIEEALLSHPAVAFAGAIGQPDAFAGELPCAYIELVEGGQVTVEDLLAFVRPRISERAAIPKYMEILPELPKTAVGKIFKPALRKLAITRIYDAALSAAGVPAAVVDVVEDKKLGLVAVLDRRGELNEDAVSSLLGDFTSPWRWKGQDPL